MAILAVRKSVQVKLAHLTQEFRGLRNKGKISFLLGESQNEPHFPTIKSLTEIMLCCKEKKYSLGLER